MKFDNKSFMAAAESTLGVLKKLGEAAILPGASKGLSALQGAVGKFNMGGMGAQVDQVSGKFVALAAAAGAAMGAIVTHVAGAVAGVARQFSGLDAMKAGFDEYELKLGSIQSILANTKGESLRDVNTALEELNKYSDRTIYNFGEMVSNIKAFTVAGIDLDRSVASVKGLANVAALTGTNSQEAARATYQMAQAMSSGTVRLQDWISMEHAGGMAGKVFQDALKRTAEVHGVNVDEMIKKNGSFRLSLQEDWLTADILNETLGQFAGAYERADLARMGYTENQIDQIMKMQREAEAAATDVKTFSALVSTLKESMGSGWAQTWEVLFGNLKESTELWTNVNNVVGGAIQRSADARNAMLKDWKEMGGRTVLIEALANVFKALGNILGPIREAFRDVFPPMTAERLYELTVMFRDFTEGLIAGEGTMDNIRSVFTAIFTVIKVGLSVLGGIIRYFFGFFGVIDGGAGGLLDLAGAIADVITMLGEWLLAGDKIGGFFDAVIAGREAAFGPLFDAIGAVLSLIADLVRMGAGVSFDFLKGLDIDLPDLSGIGDFFSSIASDIRSIDVELEGFGGTIDRVFGALRDAVSSIDLPGFFDIGGATSVAEAGAEGVNAAVSETPSLLDKIVAGFSAVFGVFGGFGSLMSRAAGAIKSFFGGMQDAISNAASGLTFTDVLAIINTGFLIALYRTVKKWADQLGGVLESASGVLDQVTENLKMMQAEVKADIILKIAAAVALLALSILMLSRVPTDKLATSLGAIAIMMTALVIALKVLEKNLPDDPKKAAALAINLTALSVAMVGIAIAMVAMSAAVAILGRMDLAALAKGVGAIAVILGIVVATSAILARTGGAGAMVLTAVAIGVLSASLIVMAGALKIFAAIDWSTLLSGLAKIGILLVGLGLAMQLMAGALPGALALPIIAFGLTVLAGALAIMAALDWSTLLSGLLKIAVVVGALALLGLIAPAITALAVALGILGVAMLAAGAGMTLFAGGIALLAVSGPAGFAVLTAAIMSFLELLPIMVQQFGLTILALAKVLIKAGPPLIKAFAVLLGHLLDEIIKITPKIGRALIALIQTGLKVIRATAPDWIHTGFVVLNAFLNELLDNIPKLAKVASEIVITFMRELGDRLPRIVDAGFKMMIKFLNGIADAIDENADELGEAGLRVAKAIMNAMIDGVKNMGGDLIDAVGGAVTGAIDAGLDKIGLGGPAKHMGMYLVQRTVEGVDASSNDMSNAVERMSENALAVMKTTMSGLSDVMANDIDFDPTITPVLDLSQLQKDLPQIGNMLDERFAGKLGADFSSVQTGAIHQSLAEQRAAALEAEERTNVSPEVKEIKYEQNIHSPKAVDPIEVYRNTRSLLTLTEEALK
jgi:tape measure domain-containing protein